MNHKKELLRGLWVEVRPLSLTKSPRPAGPSKRSKGTRRPRLGDLVAAIYFRGIRVYRA